MDTICQGMLQRLESFRQESVHDAIREIADFRRSGGGTIVEVNSALNTSPEVINQAPYEAGWLAVIQPSGWDAERSKVLDAAAYFAVMQAQVQEDLKSL